MAGLLTIRKHGKRLPVVCPQWLSMFAIAEAAEHSSWTVQDLHLIPFSSVVEPLTLQS